MQVDPVVYNMLHEDPGNVSYSAVGGLSDQVRELRESIELPLMNPELFLRVGIKPPKVSVYSDLWICLTEIKCQPTEITFLFTSHKDTDANFAGCSSLWASWNWQDTISESHC